MRGRLYPHVATTVASLALAGCVQATRHSNMMIFGTATQFGIRAGTGATSVPEINVGYSRQEAVVMPLVANTEDNGTYQTPCRVEAVPPHSRSSGLPVHPCLLVAVNGKAQDSYSVLASFGAQFDGSVQTGGTGVKGGLAQYFATGVAAQLLALNGGASVVAVGEAALASATRPRADADTLEALYGDAETLQAARERRSSYERFQRKLIDKIRATESEVLIVRLKAFEDKVGAKGELSPDCEASIAGCADAAIALRAFERDYGTRPGDYDREIDAWKTTKD
jgi:hypothetical protein